MSLPQRAEGTPPPTPWTTGLWRQHNVKQQPLYPDVVQLDAVTNQLKKLPPLVPFNEIQQLNQRLKDTYQKGGFVLQLGNCVELFQQSDVKSTIETLRFFAHAAEKLQGLTPLPVTTMARMAGQFAKPRSSITETINGITVPSFHGEIINSARIDYRTPNPMRMLKAYDISRYLLRDIHQFAPSPLLPGDNFFVQHECYLLPYEEGLCRLNPQDQLWYNTSAHALWVGSFTIGTDTAHIHFVRGLANPIGLKLGPKFTADQLQYALNHLQPHQKPGQIILIPRLGVERIEALLPPLIRAAGKAPVLWVLDPMHGNTIRTSKNIKTRRFQDICREIELFYKIMYDHGIRPHGIHCEATSEMVTECLDMPRHITEETLLDCYTTGCDPRLNAEQLLNIVELCGSLWQD